MKKMVIALVVVVMLVGVWGATGFKGLERTCEITTYSGTIAFEDL